MRAALAGLLLVLAGCITAPTPFVYPTGSCAVHSGRLILIVEHDDGRNRWGQQLYHFIYLDDPRADTIQDEYRTRQANVADQFNRLASPAICPGILPRSTKPEIRPGYQFFHTWRPWNLDGCTTMRACETKRSDEGDYYNDCTPEQLVCGLGRPHITTELHGPYATRDACLVAFKGYEFVSSGCYFIPGKRTT